MIVALARAIERPYGSNWPTLISEMINWIAKFAVGFVAFALFALCVAQAFASDISDIPAKPDHYFNDYASLVSPQTAQ